ncbi:hypothetical protein G0U57_017681 [Chelydra serpentina]|uniref:Uncharacterized protein n=1 Tax=Chelydra serpentina TaxID=8475 RepID=A0A8T1S6P4_CHESE|nr:hypothetical protein G0U57_017681 [Chelydra serpentina]
METEELEEVERHCRKATSDVKKGSSQQTASQLGVNSEDEEKSEGADHVTQDSESQTHYIAIQRNSKYYRSMRLQSRQKERNNREVTNARHAVASLKNGDSRSKPLNVDVLSRKGHPVPVKSEVKTLEEQWIQR